MDRPAALSFVDRGFFHEQKEHLSRVDILRSRLELVVGRVDGELSLCLPDSLPRDRKRVATLSF